MNTDQYLQKSIKAVMARNNNKQRTDPSCALVITFNDNKMIDRFQELMSPVVKLHRFDDILVAIMPTQKMAQEIANDVSSITYQFNQTVLEQPFEPDWLAQYIDVMSYGVNVAMAVRDVTSLDKVSDYLKQRKVSEQKSLKYQKEKISAEEAARNMSDQQMIESFTDFLSTNWQGCGSQEYLRGVIDEMFMIMREDTKGQYFLSRHSSKKTLDAITDKLKSHSNDDVAFYKAVCETENDFKNKCLEDNVRLKWESAKQLLSLLIRKRLPDIMPKGYQELLDDENADAPEHVPFGGINFSYDTPYNMDQRLHVTTVSHFRKEYGEQIADQLGGAIAAYFFKVMELQQEAAFDDLLREYSASVNPEAFHQDLMVMAEKSRPNV